MVIQNSFSIKLSIFSYHLNIFQMIYLIILKMDNNNSQAMQNWKKQIIMDPILNYLFDTTLSSEQFLQERIFVLDQQQILNIYTKLASLKHSLSKNIQKEVQAKYPQIQNSFHSLHQVHNSFPKNDRESLQNTEKYLQKFNSKYQNVEKSLQKWKNVTKTVRYAQSLQKLSVNIRLLKTLLKDSKEYASKESLNYVKLSKIIQEIIYLAQNNDFNGVPAYENQKIFIKNSKDLIYNSIEKQLTLFLAKPITQTQIKQCIISLFNINRLPDFVLSYFKNSLKQTGDHLKKALSANNLKECSEMFENNLTPKILSFSNSLIYFEQIIKQLKYNSVLQNKKIPNLFEKMFDKLIQFVRDLLKWTYDQQAKEKYKDREKLLVWKYPIILQNFQNIVNLIHTNLIENTKFNFYQFGSKKQQFILTLSGVSKNYYKIINQEWKNYIYEISEQQKRKQLINGTTILQFMRWVIKRVNNNNILTNLLILIKNHLEKMRNKFIQYSFQPQFNKFIKQLKDIFTNNQNLEIHNPQVLQPFYLLCQNQA